jgi:hypothetical protein
MKAPSKPDYVKTYFTLYERFEQEQKNDTHRGHPFDYQAKCLILFFTIMIILRISPFKTQHRWLVRHPAQRQRLGLAKVPDRTTLLRRYRRLYPTLQSFIAYLGHWAESLGPEFDSRLLIEDASLFKARCGTNLIEKRVVFLTNCAIWIRMPVGAKAPTMAGCMDIVCT